MQISFNGVKFIEDAEGYRAAAYRDGGGVWTIGYGTTHVDGKPVEQGMTCNAAQARIWMEHDLAATQTAINTLVKCPLKQNQYDSLASFVYNIGIESFRNSTMLKLLNSYQYREAAAQFNRWVMDNGVPVRGLQSRRLRERALFEA